MAIPKTPLAMAFTRFAGRLRFKQLFLITAILFLVNLIIPDPLPLIDELLLGLLTLMFASWKKDRHGTPDEPAVIEGEIVSKQQSPDIQDKA